MPLPLRLSLRILDRPPPPDAAPGLLARQVWQGGATDLSTRRMIAHPPRWLIIAEHEFGQAVLKTGDAIKEWELDQILPGRQVSPSGAGGVILVSMDVDPDREEEFNDWYHTEHIPHLSRVPGVILARRFRAISGGPRYVALYHVETTDVYATPAWMVANETPWMLRMRRYQRNRTYFMFCALVEGRH